MWYNKLMDELEKCLNKYFADENSKLYILNGKQSFIDRIMKKIEALNSIQYIDHPDGFIKQRNKIVIIEHFEIDATNKTRKGSQTRIEENRIDNELKAINRLNKVVQHQMNIYISAENLTNNFIKLYNKHFQQIENYKTNLTQKGVTNENSKFEICFVIEDITPLGTSYINQEGQRTVFSILDIKECVEAMIKSSVDYVFICNQYNNDKKITYTQKSWLRQTIKYTVSKEKIKMLNWKPVVLTANISF